MMMEVVLAAVCLLVLPVLATARPVAVPLVPGMLSLMMMMCHLPFIHTLKARAGAPIASAMRQ
jgi:hypothetical protein